MIDISFSQLRTMCKAESKSSINTYFQNVSVNLQYNPRTFWSFIRNHRDNHLNPNEDYYNGKLAFGH